MANFLKCACGRRFLPMQDGQQFCGTCTEPLMVQLQRSLDRWKELRQQRTWAEAADRRLRLWSARADSKGVR